MLLAVYGTLREGDYNHDRYLRGYHPLVTERIQGFEMFNLGGQYPYIARGADDITVDVFDIPEDVFRRIESMERGAGYEVGSAKTSQGIASIFFMTDEVHSNMQARTSGRPPKIVSGDWFEWLEKFKPSRLAVIKPVKPFIMKASQLGLERETDAS